MSYSKKHTNLVGRIIFANFLAYPLEKYRNIIEEVEISPLFKRLSLNGTIIITYLSNTTSITCQSQSPQLIAKIEKHNKGFSIKYTQEEFTKEYIINRKRLDKLKEKLIATRRLLLPPNNDEIDNLLHKLRRISYRNKTTHTILNEVIKHQKCYFQSGNPLYLLPLSQTRLTNRLKQLPIGYIDNSVISRIINGKSIITPFGEEISLKSLFSTQRQINKKLIKALLDKERHNLESGEIKKPLSDREIKGELGAAGRSISRHSVNTCRKDLGIPASWRRSHSYKYPPPSANFSGFYSMKRVSVNTNASCDSGVYELCLNGTEIKYPIASTSVIYIGSAKNIKKRLKDHLSPGSKNGSIKEFLKKHRCLFRYILVSKKWKDEERKMYDLFVSTYGAPPRCNKLHP